MSKNLVGIAALFLACGVSAQTTVRVQCAEYSQVTGLACQGQHIELSRNLWDSHKRAKCLKDSGETDLPPWQRTKHCDSAQAPVPVASNGAQCDLPPWKRPDGLVCK